IIASRLTDRPLRPLFPDGFRLDIQVVSTVLSVDQENDPTILSINGASTAIVISDVPWAGPVGAVRMGLLDGKVVVNPPMSRMAESELDLVIAGTADAILMVEAGAKGVSEQIVLEALEMAHDAIRQICAAQLELREQVGKEKRDFIPTSYPEQAIEVVNEYLAMRLDAVLFSPDKAARESGVDEARPLRGPGRREIGHGALAERALLAVIPPVEEWPYTMRLVSEILSSNGSTSMASVCGSTLALMDAGVPIKSPVAGIAMGLVNR